MRTHRLIRKQCMPITLDEAWTFFTSPSNLREITPGYMHFKVMSNSGEHQMFAGQIIAYKLSPVLGIPLTWITEITHVHEREYFVDEQRYGPYAFWHHLHKFCEIEGGIEMIDIVHYKLPLSFLGRALHSLFVKKQIGKIFDHRKEVFEKRFGSL